MDVSCTITSAGVVLLCLVCAGERLIDPSEALVRQTRAFLQENAHPHIPRQGA